MSGSFRSSDHTYWWDGTRRLMGATDMLRRVGYIDPTWYSAEACERGTFVHQCIAWMLADDLDETSLDPALGGYLTAARGFLASFGVKAQYVEVPFYDAVLGIAGTPDIVGSYVNDRGFTRGCLIDWKTGAEERWHRIQLAIYDRLVPAWPVPRDRIVVYLSDDGTYRPVVHRVRRDLEIAAAVISIAQDQAYAA